MSELLGIGIRSQLYYLVHISVSISQADVINSDFSLSLHLHDYSRG